MHLNKNGSKKKKVEDTKQRMQLTSYLKDGKKYGDHTKD
jgi:hypothetical protein